MLLCDRCNCGFHMGCLDPPLSVVPAGDWFCTQCLNEKFGFGNTRVFKYHQFERQVASRVPALLSLSHVSYPLKICVFKAHA